MLSATALLEDARVESGLGDYGGMAFAEGLNVLVNSINAEAALTEKNEALVRLYLLRGLTNRLRMHRDIVRHPEILDEEILPPVFITSLPRTGSTKLHRLLAASGDFNAMKLWQMFNFAPFSDEATLSPDPRIAATEQHVEWLRRTSPSYMDVHPLFADEVDEELYLLDAGFNSLYLYAAYLNIPSYVNWVLAQDARQAYIDIRTILKYVQWQHFRGTQRRFILKTPALHGTERTYAEVFPGMDFIVNHRHPARLLPTACAYFCASRKLYSDTDYSSIAGASLMYNFGETMKTHLQWRDSYPADKVFDVRFNDVMHDELALAERIYGFLGMTFSDTSRANIQAWLTMDAARRQQPTRHTLAEYGVDPQQVEQRFADYIAQYAKYF